MPAVRAFNDPSARSAANATDERFLTPAADVGDDAALSRLVFGVAVVVPLVEAQVLWPAWSSRRAYQHSVESGADHPLVVDVRSSQRDGDGHPAAVGQNVAFTAAFRAIGRVWAGELPPFGAFTMALSSEAHSQSIPLSWW